jgi:hypothetical protein
MVEFKGGLVWFGLVWFGLVWFGLVWFGLVNQGKFISNIIVRLNSNNEQHDNAHIRNTR